MAIIAILCTQVHQSDFADIFLFILFFRKQQYLRTFVIDRIYCGLFALHRTRIKSL